MHLGRGLRHALGTLFRGVESDYASQVTLSPLVLTGGPAAGKSSTALTLAATTPRTAFVDVDDVRQLVKNGGAAPWDGPEGARQQVLGVRNTAALARNFLASGFNATIADVVTPSTLALYRQLIPDVLVVRLNLNFEEARRRASLRRVYLTSDEFQALHRQQADALDVDHELDVSALDLDAQVDEVRRLWRGNR